MNRHHSAFLVITECGKLGSQARSNCDKATATKLAGRYIYYGQSIFLPPIPIRMIKSHPISHVNSRQISDWRAHVEASSSIPPPPVSPPKPTVDSAIYSIHEDKYNRLLHFPTVIPKSISKIINQHLQRTIGQHDTPLLSAQLPHPKTNPLVRSTPLAAVIDVHVQVSFNRRPGDFPTYGRSQRHTPTCIASGICIGFSKSSWRCSSQHGTFVTSPPCTISA